MSGPGCKLRLISFLRGNVSDVSLIRKKLGRLSFQKVPRGYLDTKSPHLNCVLGNVDKGIAWGKVIEIAGMPSAGKSALLTDLASVAQQQGAYILWIDFENSFDRDWAAARGLKCGEDETNFALMQPYLAATSTPKKLKKDKKPAQLKGVAQPKVAPPARLSTGEELIEEAEALMHMLNRRGVEKIFVALDSVTAIIPEDEGTPISEHNMRTDQALPKLLSRFVKKWVALATAYDAIIVFINQLRSAPMSFGDPHYTPGGNAIPFYAHVRVRVKRKSDSRIKGKTGKTIGVKGTMVNTKNKAGGVEGDQIAFKLYFDGRSKFMEAKEL